MTRATVLLADDHPMNAVLLRSLLFAAFGVVGDVGDGRTPVEEAERLSPAVHAALRGARHVTAIAGADDQQRR